ncbi:Gustatory receptor 1 [Ladona fulva]|uniref:Gustatory receptor n=1 Tax=Ladona fulva TaxID=123851 RepID=A0A8K0P460_LADFU|nr:Gustatory receptor 1 [Ladona fulva]
MFHKKNKRRRGKQESFSFRKIYPFPFSRNRRDGSPHLHTLKTEHNGLIQQNPPLEWTVEALLPTIKLAVYFGLLPVSIMTLHHANEKFVLYNFRWFSFRTFGTILLLFCLIVIETTALLYMVTGFYYSTKLETIELTTAGAAFYGYSVVSTIIFFRLATKLRHILDAWHQSEAPLLLHLENSDSYELLKGGPDNVSIKKQKKINSRKSIYTAEDHFSLRVLESFSRRSHWFVYEQTKYAAWKGLSLVFISFVATFIWNFTDLFIMIISLALSTRFKQLNSKLRLVSGKALSPKHWEGLRRQYASLSDLSRILDDNLNGMTFFSIASNLYFICIQLLSGLVTSTERTVDKSAFYFYSFGFLVGRAAAVILIASSINQETLNTPKHLYSCPHYSYCKEQRFMMEVTTDSVALSGLNLFNITRNFLLAVAGAVVTYEIVLLQFETTNTNPS